MNKRFLVVAYFLIFSIISGAIYSQLITTLSVIVLEMHNVSASQVASLYLVLSLCSIFLTLLIGYISDQYGVRWLFVGLSLVAGMVSTYLSSSASDYQDFFIKFVPIFCFAYLCTPQLMAIFRCELDGWNDQKNMALYNSIIRCGFAIAWIVGPPLGYYFKMQFGTRNLLRIISVLYGFAFLYALVGAFFIRSDNLRTVSGVVANILKDNRLAGGGASKIVIVFIAFSCAYAINHGYLINMPIFLYSKEENFGAVAGVIFGVAAALELPCMVLAGWLSRKIAAEYLIMIGVLSGAILCFLTPLVLSKTWLIGIQIFNGVFIGFVAGLGLTVFQNANTKRVGLMSSLYSISMTTGQILASGILYLSSSLLDTKSAFFVLMMAGVLSMFLFLIFTNLDVKTASSRVR